MTKKIHDHYTYRVTWSAEDGEFVGLCAEFPSLSWVAKTPEKALGGIRKVVSEVVVDLEKNREPVPEPLANKKFSGKILVRILPDIHHRLSMEAMEAGVSLNRLISVKLSA